MPSMPVKMHLLPLLAFSLSIYACSLASLILDLSPPIAEENEHQNQHPIPLPLLPTLFNPPTLTSDPFTTESIRRTLALYPLAIDGKDFAALSHVFAPGAVANYSAPLNVLTPLQTIQDTLSASLSCVTTQHSLGTQVIDILSPVSARSVTYYTAAHFGMGALSDQVAVAHGQYQDLWERQGHGGWRVVVRDLVYMSEVIGNKAVFVC
ncbi:hypothetical protein BDW62DRAFT_200937 [Aspergillus aurantiobrunneus]